MEFETYYDILGLPADASHRQIVNAFARLAEHYHKVMLSDPAAQERFQQIRQAYEALIDYGSRLRYNIERGLPDPPRDGRERSGGFLANLGNLVPDQWPVLLPILFLIALRLLANHAVEIWQSLGSPTWGP